MDNIEEKWNIHPLEISPAPTPQKMKRSKELHADVSLNRVLNHLEDLEAHIRVIRDEIQRLRG